ncbi:hypothetical protein M2D46_03140, partial [Klebsiella pneumoniae]|nr:hypothetical protein [Klebsiella pneumoniae]
GWDARKRAYCLKIQPATGSFARNLIYSTKPTITSGRAVTQVRKMLHNEYNINLVVSNTMDDDMIHCINAIEDQEQLLSRIAEVRK